MRSRHRYKYTHTCTFRKRYTFIYLFIYIICIYSKLSCLSIKHRSRLFLPTTNHSSFFSLSIVLSILSTLSILFLNTSILSYILMLLLYSSAFFLNHFSLSPVPPRTKVDCREDWRRLLLGDKDLGSGSLSSDCWSMFNPLYICRYPT